jgi:hypothetical protein
VAAWILMRQRALSSGLVALALIMAACVWVGCSGPMDGPRDRLGALPFPGPFTFYRIADPDNLGEHRYERAPRVLRPDEADGGILYTNRAGFLDLAHVRITVDSVRFCTYRVRVAIRERRDSLTLPTIEGSRFLVSLHYPPGFAASTHDAANERVADELAIRTGQRLAYLMMTWHEVITWFGYRSVVFIDESPSAFTYDDPMSHVVGLRVAGRALRDRSGRSFDEAVTIALRAELAELGAMPPGQTGQAVRAVEGLWWSRGRPLKRQLDIGQFDGAVRPWLVPGLASAPGAKPEAFPLPTLADVYGRDFSGFFSARIDPGILAADRMRQLLLSRPLEFDVDRDLPQLVQATRREMRWRLGADVDQPWPAHASTRPAVDPQRVSLRAPTPLHGPP